MTEPSTDVESKRRHPRRSPTPEERRRDADRSRQALLSAALDEFATKGFAGARVQDIATNAGVNKQLINYYFGGKEGLYRELQRSWTESEAVFADPDLPLEEVAARYLHAGLADPRPARLMVWRGLTGDGSAADEVHDDATLTQDLANLRQAQARGEIAAELDPGFVRLAVMGMILAPVMLPQAAREISGHAPDDPEFERHYGEQLRRLIRRLGDQAHVGAEPTATTRSATETDNRTP
ncbi:TetR family transcriptional regulator [Kitasatospora sp. NPDC089509]|uniref:TetR family transcriptional regulator n=1 Tax=Kitasatospora sp. NPDC089509 TaxID=3364079 RepID=UPI0037FE0E82